MQLNFFSGKGFILNKTKNKIYLHHSGKIHIYGELCELLNDYVNPFVHIFNEPNYPNLIHFTPALNIDNINTKPKAKDAVKMGPHKDGHYSGSCLKLIKDMNIPPGPSKRKGSKHSGHYLEYEMHNFVNRDCTIINLKYIKGWNHGQ